MIPTAIQVALGGAIGASLRYGANLGIGRLLGAAFPWHTLAVNVIGSALMGGLMVRGYLAAHRPSNLGRVVTIVPPHHGSAVSDRLRSIPVVWRIIGRNLGALGTKPDAYWRTLPQRADFELGVIAGSFALSPLSWFFLPKPNDGTVTESSTRLDGMADHIVLPSSHTLILFRKRTAARAIEFLRTGRFAR